jgi:hypothetical protein
LPRALSKPHLHKLALCWTGGSGWESTEQTTPAQDGTLLHHMNHRH